MNQGIVLLEEALNLAQAEKCALEGGEYDEAIAIAEKRSQLTGMAYNHMTHEDEEPFRLKLLELSDIQNQLTSIASKAHNAVRQRLNRSKMEKKRMRGYQIAVGQALQ